MTFVPFRTDPDETLTTNSDWDSGQELRRRVTRSTNTIIYNSRVQRNFETAAFLCRQVGKTWSRPHRPVLAITADRILVGAGSSIISHELSFGPGNSNDRSGGHKGVIDTHAIPVPLAAESFHSRTGRGQADRGHKIRTPSALDDLTGIIPLEDGSLVVSTVNGKVQRIKTETRHGAGHRIYKTASVTALYTSQKNVPIESLSTSFRRQGSTPSSMCISAAQNGVVSLFDASSPWSSASQINVPARPWSSHLCLDGSKSYATIGTSGVDPLMVLPVTPDGFVAVESHRKAAMVSESLRLSGPDSKTAVYDVTSLHPDITSPFSNDSASIILSSWFDGRARVHDLRVSGYGNLVGAEGDNSPQHLRPVLELSDPWAQSSLYSCTFVGQGNIAAGSSRHGMVHFWDSRKAVNPVIQSEMSNERSNPSKIISNELTTSSNQGAFSVFTPGRPESPVYNLEGEEAEYGALQTSACLSLLLILLEHRQLIRKLRDGQS